MNTQELTLAGMAAIPIVVGLTELAKVYVGGHYAPLVALALGLGAGVASQATLPHPVWVNGVVIGIATGLSASGLYSGIQRFGQTEPTPPAPVVPPVIEPPQ